MSDFYEEACYLSNSEAEPDSETEDAVVKPAAKAELAWDDPQALLNTWLGELDNLNMGLENGSTVAAAGGTPGPRQLTVPDVDKLQLLHEPRIDSYRFSMANLEESQDGELDAILKELCALGSQFDQELKDDDVQRSTTIRSSGPADTLKKITNSNNDQNEQLTKTTHTRSNSGGCQANIKMRLDLTPDTTDSTSRTDSGMRTESPDNDSAFSDNISMLSSESSASSGASAARTDASTKSSASNASSTAARLKAEKIRLALEKMREANVKKLYIKAFTSDGSTKSLLVDEKMTVGNVTRMLSDKNHVRMEPKWVLVEHLPDMYMERVYEDHEMLVDQLMLWTRDSRNTLLFVERPDKYSIFSRPEDYLLSFNSSSEKDRHLDDDGRSALIEEFFSGTGGNGVGVPEIEGPLYLKAEGKKAWKRFYFVLRASGIYYSPKGKSSSKSSKDLVCLATFDVNQVYTGVSWRKKFKSPTDFGFAIKHPKLQSRSSKYIKYLCAEDEKTLARWVMGIRIAKHGRALLDNYRSLVEELAQEDLDQLANARSFSLASVSLGGVTTTTPAVGESVTDENETPVNTLERGMVGFNTSRPLSRQDSLKSRASNSSSSGCLSERSSNGTATPTFENAFDSDFPMGTIKRKPSMTPKLPLTSTTRLLVKELEDTVDGPSAMEARNTLRQSCRKSLNEEVNTIRRKSNAASTIQTAPISCAVDPSRSVVHEMNDSQDVDSLPLPPPPTFSSPDDGISCDADLLPPPPPEAFNQTDCGSFPLPPAELLASNESSFLPYQQSMSPRILKSKPPSPTPPPPSVPGTLKPCLKSSSLAPNVPPKPLIPISKRESVNNQAIYANSGKSVMPAPPPPPPTQSPSKKNRRITFDEHVACSPSPSLMNSPPKPPRPPVLPKRVDPLRSSLKQQPIPQKLTAPGCTVTPPREFLKDLQRVMQKKWQVAQKCKDDTEVTPHSVLGFRDQPPPIAPVPAAYKENSVRAWVAEHYGSGSDVSSSDNSMGFYENVFVPSSSTVATSAAPGDEYRNTVELREYTHPYLPVHANHAHSARMSSASTGTSVSTTSSKRLPPPPPKRSETTHLSTRIH
ncbi:Ras-associated and pleckstrin-like proteiny domains-containing protein 1 [Daphnia sinensis]|uniref:Ras-associated and pleckstrin-like proteiny domains-containing protein 1 n=1 Tax=Daphnia sinensis TaxID=1820382 RepID=A0AAD5KH38_9CRUS|nr:Ras-associated and pleckstrin-like proteiny domains-containing protein 1 [Daphnia sinensis]